MNHSARIAVRSAIDVALSVARRNHHSALGPSYYWAIFSTAIVTAILAAMIASPVPAHAETFKVYLWLGQSNMGGKGWNDCQCRVTYGIQTSVYFYGSSSNVMPLTVTNSLADGYNFGPEVSAGPGFILKDGGPVGFIKASMGSSWISSNWLAGGNAWNMATNRIAKAMIAYSNAGHVVSGFGGMVWYQGESESQSQYRATNYYTSLTQFIGQVRDYAGSPELPVCIIQIGPSSAWTYYSTITSAQWQASISLTNVVAITPDIQGMYDSQHPDSYSLLRIGQQVYEAWIGVLP